MTTSKRRWRALELFRQDAQRWIEPGQIVQVPQLRLGTLLKLLYRYRPLRAMLWFRIGSWCRHKRMPALPGLILPYFDFAGYTTGDGTRINMDVTAALWESPIFRMLFATRWATLSTHAFAPDKLVALLDSLVAEMEPEMQRQIDRWGEPESVAFWKEQVEKLRALIIARPASAKQTLIENFALTDEQLQMLYQ